MERQIDLIGQKFKFISQEQLIDYYNKDEFPDGKYCLITFDDGLKDQMQAYDLLESKGVPSTYYVITDPIFNHTVVNVHKLHFVRSIISDDEIFNFLDKRFKIANYKFDINILNNQYRYDNYKAQKIKFYLNFILSDKEKNESIDKFFNGLVSEGERFARDFYMMPSDLVKLGMTGSIGIHSHSHRPLSSLTDQEIRNEISESIKLLNKYVLQPIYSISYPYGGSKSLKNSLSDICKEYGIGFGLTMTRGINNHINIVNRYFLRRIDTNDAPGGKYPLDIFN